MSGMLGLEIVFHILLGYIILPCLKADQIFVCPLRVQGLGLNFIFTFLCYLSSKNPEEAELEDILNSVVSAG